MKKTMKIILMIATSLFIIISAATLLINNKNRNIAGKESKISAEVSQENKDTVNSDEVEGDGIETIETDHGTILLRGSARPKNDEIAVEDAARIGVEEISKKYDLDLKDYTVEMIFLDGLLKKTGTWSGHIKLSDDEKYEFIVDGKDGNVEFIKKYK